MKNIFLLSSVFAVLGVHGWSLPAAAVSPEIVSAQEVSHVIAVTNVEAQGGRVSGVLINESTDTLRDVRLLIEQPWLWENEFHPGGASPGRASFYTVPTEIPPGGRVPFSYEAGPLPQRTDGHFETSVKVAGFTEAGSRTTSANTATSTFSR